MLQLHRLRQKRNSNTLLLMPIGSFDLALLPCFLSSTAYSSQVAFLFLAG